LRRITNINVVKKSFNFKKMKKLVLFAAFAAILTLGSCTNAAKDGSSKPVDQSAPAPAKQTAPTDSAAAVVDTTAVAK